MSSARPTRLTDDLWLAAHDSVGGKPQIGDWSLGVGLAAGLLAELVHDGFLELRAGELFRTIAEPPGDPALHPLLIKMEAEEQSWPRVSPSPPAWAQSHPHVSVEDGSYWPPETSDGRQWFSRELDDDRWSGRAYGGQAWPPSVQDENRHRRRGHELGVWISYLAYEKRAEVRVIDRLARTGLVRREERRRLWSGPTVRYVPYDSVTAATPASLISIAVRKGRALSASELVLAGLFLATGLHHHALATLTPPERTRLAAQLGRRLDDTSRELLRAADSAVGEAAMR